MDEETRWLDDAEQRAWRAYLAMQAGLPTLLNRRLQATSGLSLSDFDVLVALTDHGARPIRVGELCDLLQWEKSRLSHHLARMQRRGLLARVECADDGRGAEIVLTDEGRAAIERAAPAHVAEVRDLVFDVLDDEQVRALETIGRAVAARVEDRSGPARPDAPA